MKMKPYEKPSLVRLQMSRGHGAGSFCNPGTSSDMNPEGVCISGTDVGVPGGICRFGLTPRNPGLQCWTGSADPGGLVVCYTGDGDN